MDVEKARVTGRAERVNAQAASFLTGRTNDVAERLFHGILVSRVRMKTSEDEQLQASSSCGHRCMVAEHRGDSPSAVHPLHRDGHSSQAAFDELPEQRADEKAPVSAWHPCRHDLPRSPC